MLFVRVRVMNNEDIKSVTVYILERWNLASWSYVTASKQAVGAHRVVRRRGSHIF
jgi:hypothetical protein